MRQAAHQMLHVVGGVTFGPNVTEAFLKKHKLRYLVRSHECVRERERERERERFRD